MLCSGMFSSQSAHLPSLSCDFSFRAVRSSLASSTLSSSCTGGSSDPCFSPLPHALNLTRLSSLTTNPFRIRTYEKPVSNPFRIRTYKTQDLKPSRMNTYKKKPIGASLFDPDLQPATVHRSPAYQHSLTPSDFGEEPLFSPLLTTHCSLLTSLQKQCPSSTVKQPSGYVCPGGA
jgi:hypothetical protein